MSDLPIHSTRSLRKAPSTPMYQILIHALPKPENKTRFKLIFANLSEKDILLKGELDALKKKYPQTFDVVYTVDAAGPNWNGEVA